MIRIKASSDPLLRVMLNRMLKIHPGSEKAPKMSFPRLNAKPPKFKPSENKPVEVPAGDKNLLFGSGGE